MCVVSAVFYQQNNVNYNQLQLLSSAATSERAILTDLLVPIRVSATNLLPYQSLLIVNQHILQSFSGGYSAFFACRIVLFFWPAPALIQLQRSSRRVEIFHGNAFWTVFITSVDQHASASAMRSTSSTSLCWVCSVLQQFFTNRNPDIFRSNSCGNALGGDGNCDGGGNVWGEKVQAGKFHQPFHS